MYVTLTAGAGAALARYTAVPVHGPKASEPDAGSAAETWSDTCSPATQMTKACVD